MQRNERIEISHYVTKTKVLGPYTRSALWVQGCCFECPGCLATSMRTGQGTYMDIDVLSDIFAKERECEGLTISGGEPFLKAEMLTSLIDKIRARRDYGLIVYTGFTLEELKESSKPEFDEFLKRIDILIDGRFDEEKNDGKPYRGSSNQRIIYLSKRYQNIGSAYYDSDGKRNIEINVEAGRVNMVGVPSEYGLKVWRDLKAKMSCDK